MRQEALQYVLAVVDHWFFWFGGIVLVVFELVKRIPRWKDQAEKWFPTAVFWGIAGVCMFIATFQAWHEEHARANELSNEKIALTAKNEALNGENGRLTNQLIAKDRPIVIQAVPDAEVQKLLRRQDEELAKLKNALPSPKKRALQVSNDLLKFLAERQKAQPAVPMPHGNITREEWTQQQEIFDRAYMAWINQTAAESQTRFAIPIAEVLEDMKAENIPTAGIESCTFFNGNTFGLQHCATSIGVAADKLTR